MLERNLALVKDKVIAQPETIDLLDAPTKSLRKIQYEKRKNEKSQSKATQENRPLVSTK